MATLKGKVAVVAGATRGAGGGIARALGEAGATVYRTGRSVRGNPSPYGRPETIEETAELVTSAGETGIAVGLDHTVEALGQALRDHRPLPGFHERVSASVDRLAGPDLGPGEALSPKIVAEGRAAEGPQVNRFTMLSLAILLLFPKTLPAQQPLDLAKVVEALNKDGRVTLDGGKVLALAYDSTAGGDKVEAIAFRPAADGKYPAVLLIPGFSRTARDYLPMGLRFAREGFACVAVTQRGFGKSTGKPDFVGPKTMAGLEAGFRKFRSEPYVDGSRMGVFGYSRGATAASLLAVRLKAGDLRAAVLGAGVYDFKKAYDEIKLPGIRANMEQEAGLSDEAVRLRTSVTQMAALSCPVLILHGEKDENVPVSQAYLLRDRLKELNKEFELKTFPDREHDIGRQNLYDHTFAFFKRNLAIASLKE